MERITTGSISRTSASDTAKALCSKPSVVIQTLKTNRAATIDGTPDEHVDHEGGDPGQPAAAVLDEVDRDHQPERHGDDRGDERLDEGAVDRVVDAAAELLGQDAAQRVASTSRRTITAREPLTITSTSTHTSGTSAMRNAQRDQQPWRPVFLIRRPELIGLNVGVPAGRASVLPVPVSVPVAVLMPCTFPPAIARAMRVDDEGQDEQHETGGDVGAGRQRLAELRRRRGDLRGEGVAAVEQLNVRRRSTRCAG